MKLKLYIDFDGVILNTTNTLEQMMIDQGLGLDAWEDLDDEHFFLSLNWQEIIAKSSPIADSINNIQKLIDSNMYELAILTHVNSKEEWEQKQSFLNQYFEDLTVIPVAYPTPKYQVVDCQNAILVDDYTGNLVLWQEHGGIPIKFSTKDKKYDYKSIKCLDALIVEYPEISKLTSG